jgi:TetR/AcrR family transcriptional regulator, cholesterol catabolism regulator
MAGEPLVDDGAVAGPANGRLPAESHVPALPPPSDSTARAILLTAAELFRRDGYSKATTRQLGDAVGIRGPSVYYHFKSKEDILLGICTESLSRLSAAVRDATLDHGETLPRLRAMIETHVRALLDDGDMHTTALTEMRWLSHALLTDVTDERDAYEAMFRTAVADAQVASEVRADLDARVLTRAILGLMNWTVFWYRPDGELAADEIASVLLTLLLEGVVPREGHAAATDQVPAHD